MNPKVDAYLSRAPHWQEVMEKLRLLLLDCGLTEELKWGKPCYTFQGKNIVVIQGFKEYCALLFLKGFLLSDTAGILVLTGGNTHVGRQVRFTDVREVVKLKTTLKAYIYEAVEVEEAGLKVPARQNKTLPIPEEFQQKLDTLLALSAAFDALTPGRQRAYIYYFSEPKQSKTRMSRVDKWIPQIMAGMGLMDR